MRRSERLANTAFQAVERAEAQNLPGKECKARAEELPVRLMSGLLATAAVLDAKAPAAPAYRFVRDALIRGIQLRPDATGLTPELLKMTEAERRRAAERASKFAWWLKRAAAAKWG